MKQALLAFFGLCACNSFAITATKTYVDRQDALTYTNAVVAATNIAAAVTSNVVTKSYVEDLGISAGLTTNDVLGIVDYKRDLTNMIVSVPCNEYWRWHIFGTNTTTEMKKFMSIMDQYESSKPYYQGGWKLDDFWTYKFTSVDSSPIESDTSVVFNVTDLDSGSSFRMTAFRESAVSTEPVEAYYIPTEGFYSYSVLEVCEAYTDDATNELAVAVDSRIDEVSAAAYPATSGNTLATQVATIGAHLNAEDARFVSTNYNSSTHMPEAYVEIKLTNDTWTTIWREMTRFAWMTNTYLPTNYASKAELADKADRAWGYYDSHTGEYAPDGYTWVSSPKIAIAAGLAYQRTLVSEGAIWVLESNGLVTQTGGDTNGFFRIVDEEGNTQFEIVKGDKRTIGADATNVTVLAGYTPTKMQIGYSVQSETHPTIEVCTSLTNLDWKAETDADCLANVTWTGSSGAWVATVQGKAAQPSMFVRATFESGGETYIRNAAPVSMTHIYLGGVKYEVGTNTISGKLVLTLTPSY